MRRWKTLLMTTAISVCATSSETFAQAYPGYNFTCDSGPTEYQVYIYTGTNYYGTCVGISTGFFATYGSGPFGNGSGAFGLPNDSIRSMKIGSGVRVRAFTDDYWQSNYTDLTGNLPSMPSGWDSNISSMRVIFSYFSASCDNLPQGTFAVFRDWYFQGDCVILGFYPGASMMYGDPFYMGITNDSISSVRTGPAYPTMCRNGGYYQVRLYQNDDFDTYMTGVTPGNNLSELGAANDQTSSILAHRQCY